MKIVNQQTFMIEKDWHRWFAWYPVHLKEEGKIIWLKYVYRRKIDMLWGTDSFRNVRGPRNEYTRNRNTQ